MEAQPPRPTQSKETAPCPDGKSEQEMVPSSKSAEPTEEEEEEEEEEAEAEAEAELEAAAEDKVVCLLYTSRCV